MRTDPKHLFQMQCMQEHGNDFILVVEKSKEHSKAYIIDAALHGAIECTGVPVVISLGPGRMHLGIGWTVIGFLKQDVSSDASFLQLRVVLNGGAGYVYVYAPNASIVHFDGVDGSLLLRARIR